MNLQNKVALVTGAGVRLGQAIAQKLGQMGIHVVIHYHQSEKGAKQTAELLKENKSRKLIVQANLKNISEIENLLIKTEEILGSISILINNAADFFPTPFFTTNEDEWDHLFDINLKAPFFLTQKVAKKMKTLGEGKIINLVDVSVDRPWVNFLPYCASKAGLCSLTKGLARTLAPEIQVNAIAPGTILDPPNHREMGLNASVENSLLKRIGSSEDIVKAVEYLLKSDFVTGTILPVDGGRSIY